MDCVDSYFLFILSNARAMQYLKKKFKNFSISSSLVLNYFDFDQARLKYLRYQL